MTESENQQSIHDEGLSNEYAFPPKQEIISGDLLKQIKEIVDGSSIITKIETDEQQKNAVTLGKRIKAIRLDAKNEGDRYVKPLYKKYKDGLDFVNEKIKSLETAEKSLIKVIADYQWVKQLEAEKARKLAEKEEMDRKIALANLQNERIEQEELLRQEAIDKLADAELLAQQYDKIKNDLLAKRAELSVSNDTIVLSNEIKSLQRTLDSIQQKRLALINSANLANDTANIAIEEAKELEIAIQESTPEPVKEVFKPQGFSVKQKLVGTVYDYAKALKWFVNSNNVNYLESSAFQSVIDSAVKKYLARDVNETVNIDGVSISKETVGRL